MKDWKKEQYADIIWKDKHTWEDGLLDNTEAKEKSGYNDWLVKQMKLSNKDVFLVIGCGDGSILAKAAEKCKYCIGVDLTKHSLQITKKLLKKRKINLMARRPKKEENIPLHTAFVRFATANNLPFKDKMFDKVHLNLGGAVAVDDKYYVEKLMRIFLEEAARVTKDNGFIYYTYDLSDEDGVKIISRDWKTHILPKVNKKLEKQGLKLTMKTKYTRNREYLTQLKKIDRAVGDWDSYLLLLINKKTKL